MKPLQILLSGALLLLFCMGIPQPVMAQDNGSTSSRSTADRKRDASSRPHKVIAFSGIGVGDKVLDLFGGGGYFSEVIARHVGAEGHVVLHNNKAYMPYVAKELANRTEAGRLSNVTTLISEAEQLKLGINRFDSVFFVLGYHDFYVKSADWQVSADEVIPQVYTSLKPRAKLLVIDHHARPGTGVRDAQKLHRVEMQHVIDDLQKRGFRLLKSSELLHNAKDDHKRNVFDPEIRRKTDRFLLLFEKVG